MYTVMKDYIEYNTRYPRRFGKVTNKLDAAIARAKKCNGYVMCGVRVVWC